ncbi:MAG: Fe-S cluster assembly sulfur transfer protein SufU [Thermoanaerobaculia bacterium]
MTSELQALYQEVLLDHYRKPRHFGELAAPTGHAEGHNPLCGDRIEIDVQVDGDTLTDIAFRGSGCAISTASASLMSEAIAGHPLTEVRELSERFRRALTGKAAPDAADLGKLEALLGVRDFPMRVKCATLAWHALASALGDSESTAPVSTE